MATALEQILSANSFTNFSPDDAAENFTGEKSNPGGIPRHVAAPSPAERPAELLDDRSPAANATIAIPGRPATRPEPPAPCPICSSPLFWVSVYDAARLNCWGCDYPPAWAMVAERWALRNEPGAGPDGCTTLAWEQHPRERWAAAGWERLRTSERAGERDANQPLAVGAVDVGGGEGAAADDRYVVVSDSELVGVMIENIERWEKKVRDKKRMATAANLETTSNG